MANNTTWRKLIKKELAKNGDSESDILFQTLSQEELDDEFDAGHGISNGLPFTMWTIDHVYFPAVYDGWEWCASVRRDPCDLKTAHIGCE